MTEFGIPFDMPQNPDNPDDYLFSAAEERMRIGAQMTDGVFPEIRLITTDATAPEQVVGNSLVVTAGEGMNVILGKGIALCGSTFYFNTAEKIIPVSEGINDIVIELNLADDKISAINQTRADGNIEDSLVRTVSRWQIALATVTVPEGTETIDFSMITDHRLNTTPCSSPDGHPVCGLVGSALQLSADMILDEWNYIKGQLSEDQAGHLLSLIGDIRELPTDNKSNLVEAINEAFHKVDGIPVDLTGIYNTQVIGYDETQGKLVPMINVARTETVLPNTLTPVPWVITETVNCVNTNRTDYPECSYTGEQNENIGLVSFKGYFTTPFVLSEFTTFKVAAYRTWNTSFVSNWNAKLNLSKTSDFKNIDAQFTLRNSSDTTGDITNLNGIFYVGFEVSFEVTSIRSNIEYADIRRLSFSLGG